MKKTFKILFMVMLVANISFGQGGKKVSIKFSYSKLSEINTLLGDKNSIAFYAEKKANKTKLSYAIYDPNTLDVSYYNGQPITNTDFKKLRDKMKLDLRIKFSNTEAGASGTPRDGNKHFMIMAFKIFKNQMKKADVKKSNFLYVTIEDNKTCWKIANKNGKTFDTGGGGGETVVSKAP